eukprot:1720272-Pyramimonas_sp.AAC.1
MALRLLGEFDYACVPMCWPFCEEDNSWSDALKSASGTHATIWGQIKVAAGVRRTSFFWVPSH